MSSQKSIAKAFKSDRAKGYAETYLSEILTNWRDCEKSLSRTALALLLACVVAQVIHQGIVSKASIAGVEITNFKIVEAFLPVVIAFLYATLMSLAAESSMTETSFEETFKILQPELYQADLERPLYPTNMTFLTGDRMAQVYPRETRTRKLVELSANIRGVAIILAPIFYEVYLFVVLFEKSGSADIWLWISLTLSIILFAGGIISVIAAAAAPSLWESPPNAAATDEPTSRTDADELGKTGAHAAELQSGEAEHQV